MVGVPCLTPLINGREVLLAQKVETLIRGEDVNLSIIGGAGIGKTAFALAIAQHPNIMKRFKDGILWMNLGRYSDPATMIARWAKLLDIDLVRNATYENRIRAIQQVIYQREFLIILDDVSDLDIAYRLGCSASRCALIISSENPEIGKTYSGRRFCVELSGLDNDSLVALVKSVYPDGANLLEMNDNQLVKACGGNPLLVKRAAAYLRLTQKAGSNKSNIAVSTTSSLSFSRFLEGITACSAEKQKLNYITRSILSHLPSRLVTVFYRLGAFRADPYYFDLDGALSVSEAGAKDLQSLIELQLLCAEGDVLWFSKDVGDFLQTHTPERSVKIHRTYYQTQLGRYSGNNDGIQSIYAQVKWSFRSSPHDKLSPYLFGVLAEYLIENGLWQDYLEMGEKSLEFAKQNEDQSELTNLYNYLAKAYSILNQKEKALDYYNHALNIINLSGNRIEQASILNNIGTVYANLSQNEDALKLLEQARTLVDGEDDPLTKANIYNNLGSVQFALGDIDRALDTLEHAVNLVPSLDDNDLINRIYYNLAITEYTKGDLNKSIIHLRYALEIGKNKVDPDFDLDLELLSEMEKEVTKPRIIRWIQRKINSL
jgi:tetratricopeptide (TPR) repeat protein